MRRRPELRLAAFAGLMLRSAIMPLLAAILTQILSILLQVGLACESRCPGAFNP